MTQAMTKLRMDNAIERVIGAEKVTKKDMIEISRGGLLYVWETCDIGHINRLITAFAGVRKTECIAFFTHFLPHDVEKDKAGNFVRFGKLHRSEKKIKRKQELVAEFLADETNNIWTWSDNNLELKKAIDTAKALDTALERAVKGVPEKNGRPETPPMTTQEVMTHILASGAFGIEDLLKAADDLAQANADAAKVMNHEVVNVPVVPTDA